MRIKKLVSAFSALAITVTAIAGLAVTASAAEIAFSQNFTGESTDPADYGFIKISEDTDTNIPKDETEARTVSITSVTDGVLTNSCFMGSSGGGRGMEYAANFTAIGAGNEVTVQYTWNTGSATGNKTDAYSDTYLADSRGNKIFELRYYGQDKYLWLNGKSVANGVDREGSYNVSVTIDMNTKKITSLSVGNAYSISDAIDFYSSDANDVARFGFIHRGRASWINTSSIDNIVITYEAAKAPVESVSVQYKTADGAVIETVSLDSLYKLDKEEYQKVALGTVYVGDTCYIPWQKYIFKDGVLYETTRNNKKQQQPSLWNINSDNECKFCI